MSPTSNAAADWLESPCEVMAPARYAEVSYEIYSASREKNQHIEQQSRQLQMSAKPGLSQIEDDVSIRNTNWL